VHYVHQYNDRRAAVPAALLRAVAPGMAQASLSTRAMPVKMVSPSPCLPQHLYIHVHRPALRPFGAAAARRSKLHYSGMNRCRAAQGCA
jgi:hypothetical protein